MTENNSSSDDAIQITSREKLRETIVGLRKTHESLAEAVAVPAPAVPTGSLPPAAAEVVAALNAKAAVGHQHLRKAAEALGSAAAALGEWHDHETGTDDGAAETITEVEN